METEEIVAFKYIDEFFRKLRTSDNELPTEDIGKFLNMLNDNIPYSQNVIDRMLLYYKNNFFTQINNYNNFNHFAGLLNTILFNIDRKKEYLDINFAIIYIAEKTFYKNKENSYNKIYLSSLLSKNKIYSDKKFWSDLIDLKLNSVVESKYPNEIKKKENELIVQQNKLKQQMLESQKKEEEEKSNINNINENNIVNSDDNYFRNSSLNNESNLNSSLTTEFSNLPSSTPITPRKSSGGTGSLMNMFGNKVKNFFSNSNSGNYHTELNKGLSHSLDVDAKKHLKLEPLLQVNKEQILENLKKNESASIIREFLTHFCNFNFDVSEANDLIVEYSIKYNYEPEKVNLYISMLNSNMFTIKNKSAKVSYVDYKTTGIEKHFKKYINLNDNKLIILASSLKYVNLTDYPNLLTVNKNYNKKISKIIFSNILLNYQGNNKNNLMDKVENQKKIRLGIWRNTLNIVNNLKYKLFLYS